MKKLIPLCLALIAGINGLACSSSDNNSTPCAAAKARTGISAECVSCVQSKCSSQYNSFCSSCDTGSAGGSNVSSACNAAEDAVGECSSTNCPVCDPSSASGGAGSGSGGASSSGAGASSSNAGASSSSAGATASGDGEACTIAGVACEFFPSSTLPPASADSQCNSAGGNPSAHCATANLVGCCVSSDSTSCYYIGTVAELQSSCSDDSGTWTTTAP